MATTNLSEFYSSKKILAPMVRAGRTALRNLALDYGADIVYTEEIVDHKLISSRRFDNVELNTIDFITGDEVVLRVASNERSKCIIQIGTSSAENAANVCQRFGGDVAGIDLNMGCPKPFSVHAGMGAALLSDPVKVKEILTAMVSNSSVPVSCKIRVLDSPEKTMEFVRMVENCGVSALVVHGRRRDERPSHDCRVSEIRDVCRALSIPVIANGGSQDIKRHEDIERFREQTGASSVMIARKAFTNPSIFRKEGILEMDEEIRNFLEKACLYDENYTAVKYAVQRILGSQQEFDPRGKATVAAGTVREICRIWGMEEKLLECRRKRNPQIEEENEQQNPTKRPRTNGELEFRLVDGVFTTNIGFPMKRLKKSLNGAATPKCVLNKHCLESQLPSPLYETMKRDSRFTTVISVNGKQFTSTASQPNMKMAEQVAALVALHGLHIRHKLEGEWEDI